MTATRPERVERIERLCYPFALAAIGALIVCDGLPVVLLLAGALVVGATTGHLPEGRGLVPSDGYPPIDTQLWLAWGPVFIIAAWITVTFPVPLGRRNIYGRGFQLFSLLMTFLFSTARVLGFATADGYPHAGTLWIFPAVAVLAGIVVVRVLLGWFRLLPRSWRIYLDEYGNRITPTPFPSAFDRMHARQRRRRLRKMQKKTGKTPSPLSEIPQ
jgi:hypothetical protein